MSRISVVSLAFSLALGACGGGGDDTGGTTADALPDAASAESAAEALVGGTASEAEAVSEDGFDLWEVYVTMPNAAEVEVLLFREDGALFEIEDGEGPFDYDDLDPLPGQLTYAAARDVAFGEVAGEQIAWEVKFSDDGYFYEFYVEQAGDQLWEIKLYADDGEVFVVEAVDEID
jgi:uncharacterized membrane protein YkoI